MTMTFADTFEERKKNVAVQRNILYGFRAYEMRKLK